MSNIESDPHPVHTSLMRLNFGEGAGDSGGLEEKTMLFLSAKGVGPQDTA